MRAAHVVEIETPKKYLLNGLWWGPTKPKRAIIFIHGLRGSVFSVPHLVQKLVDKNTAVLTFNNRGFGLVNTIKRRVGTKTISTLGGSSHEVFTKSPDDIQGAINFVRRAGVRQIFIAGHSTGCQKATYWARRGRGVKGIILLAPVSDYAAALKEGKRKRLLKAVAYAKRLIRSGRKHELLPKELLTHLTLDDAQRFVSLYTADSPETMFSYEQPHKIPGTLRSVRIPIFLLWAEEDEYADRPVEEIVSWFNSNIRAPYRLRVIPKVGHSFKGGEGITGSAIRGFMKEFS